MSARATDKAREALSSLCVLLLAAASGCTLDDLLHGTQGADSGAIAAAVDATTASPPIDAATKRRDASSAADAGDSEGNDIQNTSNDLGMMDAGNADASLDGVYGSLDDPGRWAFFSLGTGTSYSGVAFDGRYLYFVPDFSPPDVLRYDTQGGFTDAAAWTHHVPTAALVAAGGVAAGTYAFLGGAFDRRYVYFSPSGSNSYAVRYDTRLPFTDDASWSAFNTATLDSSASYAGVLSDGRYAYFVPNRTTKVLAFDSAGSVDGGSDFTSAAAFSVRDLGSSAQGFRGGVFDGKYVYLAPSGGSVAVRHDALLPATAAWDVGSAGFDLGARVVPALAAHFAGAAYDGARIYMVPKATPFTLAAYATSLPFNDAGSWSTCALGTSLFDAAVPGSGFAGAAFDGKRLFLSPSADPGSDGGGGALPILAYDTTQPFCSDALGTAYTTFDPTSLEGGTQASGFEGAAFDGRYVYFVPHASHVVARFEAKRVSGGLSPPVYGGSWW